MLDSSLGLKAGNVFQWDNYPLFEHEQKDRRWFLFLGSSKLEGLVYEITTTTQYQYYENNGKRRSHIYFKIRAGIAGLIADSIVDITQYFEEIPDDLLNREKENIHKMGALPQYVVNTLLHRINDAKNVPPIIKKDIYGYFREAGYKVNAR